MSSSSESLPSRSSGPSCVALARILKGLRGEQILGGSGCNQRCRFPFFFRESERSVEELLVSTLGLRAFLAKGQKYGRLAARTVAFLILEFCCVSAAPRICFAQVQLPTVNLGTRTLRTPLAIGAGSWRSSWKLTSQANSRTPTGRLLCGPGHPWPQRRTASG